MNDTPPLIGQASAQTLALWTGASLLALLLWDTSGGDMALARLAADARGFALRDNWWMTEIGHQSAKQLSWLLIVALTVAVWFPVGPLKRLSRQRRLELALAPLIAGLAITLLKTLNYTSCPWDLKDFGGAAQYLSHWRFQPDGGSGRCFPAGHAAHGFSMMVGYFVFRDIQPLLARRWLLVALLAGLTIGLVQQWRGAHFMSHTLWTAWLCWVMLWGMDTVWRNFGKQHKPQSGAPGS